MRTVSLPRTWTSVSAGGGTAPPSDANGRASAIETRYRCDCVADERTDQRSASAKFSGVRPGKHWGSGPTLGSAWRGSSVSSPWVAMLVDKKVLSDTVKANERLRIEQIGSYIRLS